MVFIPRDTVTAVIFKEVKVSFLNYFKFYCFNLDGGAGDEGIKESIEERYQRSYKEVCELP